MSEPGHWFERNPLWFKTAVFYEVHIRGFFDGNDDGAGDFRGLTDKLDYLQWLGIDCVWLLPMYPSPLKDGGYDIADFFAIHPDYGTVEDFKTFVEAAHQRGIRVIADLVMNHTSADHPWFQASRSDPEGPYGDYYVWSDTDDRWPEARIIFTDTEPSNWSWDPVRGQYFWHRFFSHQPDLNYDNPEVGEAMLNVLRFWLDLGIDGFRLDAVPYLYERDGTNGENLPESHEYLKRVRAEVDARYPDRVLLAEANQWPDDVVAYFGDGDECHMAFHFPVMPRMFMALRREDATPILEILDRTPAIPDAAQWGLFLRNHDELTLEMVTDEERDYMYSEYAKDPRMKLNVGIRRRLAPLLDNARPDIELLHAIMFSLPAHPSSTTGRDRDGRQHLPRRPRRRADADAVDERPQRRLLARRLRAAVPAAADGSRLRVPGREHRGRVAHAVVDAALAAALHPAAQGASRVRPRHLRAAAPREPAHLRAHPPLRGRRDPVRAQRRALRAGRRARPVGVRRDGSRGDVRPHELPADRRPALSAHTRTERILLVPTETQLIEFVTAQRWFGSKSREATHAQVLDGASLHEAEPELRLELVEIGFDTGTHETYQLLTSGKELDALADPRHVRELVHMMRGGVTVQAGEGTIEFRPVEGFAALGKELTSARVITAEQSNTSIVFDDELILKVFRRLEAGVNPELELLRFLTERDFPNIAQLGGWYAYVGKPMDATLGVLQEYVRNGVDGWELALDELEAAPEQFLSRLRRLGQVTGSMHTVLGSDPSDPNFAPRSRASRRSRCSPRPSRRRSTGSSSSCRRTWRRSIRSAAAARRCASRWRSSRTRGRSGGSSATTATSTSGRPCSRRTTG